MVFTRQKKDAPEATFKRVSLALISHGCDLGVTTNQPMRESPPNAFPDLGKLVFYLGLSCWICIKDNEFKHTTFVTYSK